MAVDTYTARARYILMGTGNDLNVWGQYLNTSAIQLIEDSIMGATPITVSGPVTLTANNGATDQSRMAILQCSGSGGTITTPGVQNRFLIDARAMTGAVVLTTGGTVNATVEAGNIMEVYCPDSINWYATRDTNIATTAATTLASANAYTDNKVVASSGALPGSSTPTSVVYTDPVTGKAVWHILTESDITGLSADIAYNRNLALAFAVSF